jgi:hypothetical protein
LRVWLASVVWSLRSIRKDTINLKKNIENRHRRRGPNKTREWCWKAIKIIWNWSSCVIN